MVFSVRPAGCAAALKTLEIYERDNILGQAESLGQLAERTMADWEDRFEIVSQVRGLGLLLGVSFKSLEEDGEAYYVARSVRDEMLRRGVWAICDNEPQIRLYPALNMDPATLQEGLDIMADAIATIERKGVTIGDYPSMPSGNVGF